MTKTYSQIKPWPITLLVATAGIVIALIIVFTFQESLTISLSILSIVLGWLLKTLSDSLTMQQRRQWDLEDIARNRSLNYYENKLNDISRFITDEIMRLSLLKQTHENGNWRVDMSEWQITPDWLESSSAVRTFVQVIARPEVVDIYLETYDSLDQLNEFIDDVNLGKYDHLDTDDQVEKAEEKIGNYMDKLKGFQLVVEQNRLDALRNELDLSIEQNK